MRSINFTHNYHQSPSDSIFPTHFQTTFIPATVTPPWIQLSAILLNSAQPIAEFHIIPQPRTFHNLFSFKNSIKLFFSAVYRTIRTIRTIVTSTSIQTMVHQRRSTEARIPLETHPSKFQASQSCSSSICSCTFTHSHIYTKK